MKKSFQSAQNHISFQFHSETCGAWKEWDRIESFFLRGCLTFPIALSFHYNRSLFGWFNSIFAFCYPYECNLRLCTKLVSGCFVLFQSIVVLLNYWGIKWLLLLPNKCRANMNEFESDWYCCQKNLIWLAQWIYPEKFKRSYTARTRYILRYFYFFTYSMLTWFYFGL